MLVSAWGCIKYKNHRLPLLKIPALLHLFFWFSWHNLNSWVKKSGGCVEHNPAKHLPHPFAITHLTPMPSQCADFEQWSEEAALVVHNALRHNITYSLDLGATAGRPCLPVGGESAQADSQCTIDCAALAQEVGTYVVQVVSARIPAHITALCCSCRTFTTRRCNLASVWGKT